MRKNPWGWEAHVVREPGMDAHRLYLWRPATQSQSMFLTGELMLETVNDGEAMGRAGLLLPQSAWHAIEACVDPQPHAAEMRRLEDALKLEQVRVDQILTRALQ